MKRLSLSTGLVLCCLVALAIAMAGLTRSTLLHRSYLEPQYPQDLSDVVQARGFPVAWLITGPPERLAGHGWRDRFLAGRFLFSWGFFAVLVGVASRGWLKTIHRGQGLKNAARSI